MPKCCIAAPSRNLDSGPCLIASFTKLCTNAYSRVFVVAVVVVVVAVVVVVVAASSLVNDPGLTV